MWRLYTIFHLLDLCYISYTNFDKKIVYYISFIYIIYYIYTAFLKMMQYY